MLTHLLCKISNEGPSKLRFIPYDIQSLSKQGTMRNIILQHNIFLQNMVIVPIVNISNTEKENVKKLFESSLYFSGFDPTRKESEGVYLLVTNKSVLNKAQNKADNLLHHFCGKRQTTTNKIYLKEKNVHSFTTKSLPMLQPYLKILPKLLLNQ